MQRAANAETKAGLRSSAMVRDLDIRCPRGHRPSNSIASRVQTQGTAAKMPRPEESKSKDIKAVYANAAERSEQDKKDKKDRRDKKRRFRKKKNQKKPRPLATTPSMPLKRTWGRSVTLVRSRASTAIRKTITPATAPSLQKTSIGLYNLCAGDQWEQKDCR